SSARSASDFHQISKYIPHFGNLLEKHLSSARFAADFHQISKSGLHFGNLLEKHLPSARSAADFEVVFKNSYFRVTFIRMIDRPVRRG
ncbi:MAG: hypothetical protein VZR13_06450, partial [Saccharofermentanaceae bacterium]|nr:hypothetical protein [Saccharofermentanaceae bacterium]